MRALLPLLLLAACQPDPSDQLDQTVEYRDGLNGGPESGERGTVKISEILWSGSVRNDGTWDPKDLFIELRNEGNRPINVSGWRLEVEGAIQRTYRIPASDIELAVGEQRFIAVKTTGCFPEPDWVIPDLELPLGDPFRINVLDADERLMEPAGNREMPPYAGGYDMVSSYSMELINLMFGGRGSEPQSWHFYNLRTCPNAITDVEGNAGMACFEGIPNNDKVAENCRRHTLASPGRPNSPDYSGAFAAGGLD